MTRHKRIAILFLIAVCAGLAFFWQRRPTRPSHDLTLYGNVDIREVDTAFYDSGRLGKLLVQEGDVIHRGELLAQIDDGRFKDALDAANAEAENQKQILAALKAGTRPAQIAQAKANMDALAAVYKNAGVTYRRLSHLTPAGVTSVQQRDNAQSAFHNAQQNYEAARQAYVLAVEGPRAEDIAAAEAAYNAATAKAALAAREYRDTKLYAPADGIIEDRIHEPGDMVSPATPVYTIALTNPVWVRAYVPETDLGRIYPGMKAEITTDSFPGKIYRGWIGYISPTAEFTPKNVETPDLRAQLVYQVRIYACAADRQLRLGMPATVTIDLLQKESRAAPRGAGACGGHAGKG